MDLSEVDTLLEDCEKRESRLSEWERGFIDSLQKLRADGKSLSEKQYARLSEIWERIT